MPKKVLVVGANFMNKGAQSMLFIVTDEVKKRFHECEVFFACNGEKYNEKDYKFKRLMYTKLSQDMALGENINKHQLIKTNIKNLAKLVLRGSDDFFRMYDAKKILPTIDLIIDVSGYALGNISTAIEHEYYLDNIRIARKYNIPIILMPQSFGPFEYSPELNYLKKEMEELLPYCDAIFTREEEGYEFLNNDFGLVNLRRSVDLVLQNKKLDVLNVCTETYSGSVPELEQKNNVAIIPNYHCFTEEYKEHSYELYRKIITRLLEAGKNVYVFRHASFDLEICRNIVDMFDTGSNVNLIEREFDCIEYDELVRKFDFIICSRYHGCVHAYRNYVPNIILGWAVKYRELAKLLEQGKYIFNITSKDCNDDNILEAVEYLIHNYSNERNIIKEKMEHIQQDSCFKVLDYIK